MYSKNLPYDSHTVILLSWRLQRQFEGYHHFEPSFKIPRRLVLEDYKSKNGFGYSVGIAYVFEINRQKVENYTGDIRKLA